MDSGSDSRKTEETELEADAAGTSTSTQGQGLKRKRSELKLSEAEVTQLDSVSNHQGPHPPPETGMEVNEPESDREAGEAASANPMEMSLELLSKVKVMNNQVVMKSIAEKLPAGRLLGLRETCTFWNSNFIPQLKKKHSEIGLNNFVSPPGPHMPRFVKIIRDSQVIPFTRYNFDINGDPPHRQQNLDCFFEFIQTYGNTVTSLKLHWERITDLEISQLRQIIFHDTPELVELKLTADGVGPIPIGPENQPKINLLPKLRHLAVMTPDLGEIVDSAFMDFLMDVIWNADQLEGLELYGGGSDEFVAPILEKLLTLPHLNKLKTLKLDSYITSYSAVLHDLATREDGILLSLSSLSIEIWQLDKDLDEDGLEWLSDFLATQSPTLTKLKIVFESGDQQPELCRIPRLERLNKLKILDSILATDQLQFTKDVDGKFVDTFPELKQFSYVYYFPNGKGLENVSRLYHPGVTIFKLKMNIKDFVALSNFGSIFPSLTRLDLILSGRTGDISVKEFGKIWSTWSELTVVRIKFDMERLDLDLDAIVSGIPRAGLEHLRHNLDFATANLTAALEKYKTGPSISDLKHLQEFVIRFDDNDNNDSNDHLRPRLTDTGGYLGVAFASPTLQHLVIQGSGQNLVSESCLAFIRQTFGPCAVLEL